MPPKPVATPGGGGGKAPPTPIGRPAPRGTPIGTPAASSGAAARGGGRGHGGGSGRGGGTGRGGRGRGGGKPPGDRDKLKPGKETAGPLASAANPTAQSAAAASEASNAPVTAPIPAVPVPQVSGMTEIEGLRAKFVFISSIILLGRSLHPQRVFCSFPSLSRTRCPIPTS